MFQGLGRRFVLSFGVVCIIKSCNSVVQRDKAVYSCCTEARSAHKAAGSVSPEGQSCPRSAGLQGRAPAASTRAAPLLAELSGRAARPQGCQQPPAGSGTAQSPPSTASRRESTPTSRAQRTLLPRSLSRGCSPASAVCSIQVKAQISQGSFIWCFHRGNS